MADNEDKQEESAKPTPTPTPTPTPEGYEPPRVEWLGNLRDLVGKSGTGFDIPKPNPRRP